jgi:ABC-type phosphate transport system substrate-binding protein
MKFFLLIASIAAASAQNVCGPTGATITIAGSSTVEPIAIEWAAGYQAKCPGITVNVTGGGSSVGARRVCNLTSAGSAVEIGNMSRNWRIGSEVNVTDADKRKFKCLIGTGGREVTQIDVAIDGLTVALINGGLAAQCLRRREGAGLSIDQLRWIYSNYSKAQLIASGWDASSVVDDGNETSYRWTEVGGSTCPNIDIKLSSPGSLSGTFDFFKEVVLPNATEGFATKRGILFSEIDEELVEFVETSSEEVYGDAISYFGFSFFINEGQILYGVPIQNKGASVWVAPTVATVNDGSYVPLSRRIYMNVLDSSLTNTGPFISFGLNQVGIGLVRKTGYVPPPFEERAGILARIGRDAPDPPVPTPAPTRPPVPIAPSVPTVPTAPSPSGPSNPTPSGPAPCGLLNLSIFCPLTFCGIFGRLFGLCN